MQVIKDGASLTGVKSQDGKPVLGSGVTQDVANGVASNLATLHNTASKMYPPSMNGKTFVVIEKPSQASNGPVKHTLHAAMKVAHLPEDFALGMRLQDGAWVQHTAESAKAHLTSLSRVCVSWNDITSFAGDVWHHLEQLGDLIINGLKDTAVFLSDGISFIINKVEDALIFVLNIGDKVLKIALKTFVLVFKALSFLLSLVGIDLSAVPNDSLCALTSTDFRRF